MCVRVSFLISWGQTSMLCPQATLHYLNVLRSPSCYPVNPLSIKSILSSNQQFHKKKIHSYFETLWTHVPLSHTLFSVVISSNQRTCCYAFLFFVNINVLNRIYVPIEVFTLAVYNLCFGAHYNKNYS